MVEHADCIIYTAPSATEFEDLQSFLCCRYKKKADEKAKRAQHKITNYFTVIKTEPNYDGDDEGSGILTTKSNSTVLGDEDVGNSSAASNEDVTSRRPVTTPVNSLQVGRGHSQTGRFAQRPGSTSPGIRSPNRENGGSPLDKLTKFMPTGTFIPISMTFRSIADTCRTGYVSPRNLQGAFDEVSNSSKEAGNTSEIVIQPTVQVIDNTEEQSGLMINAEC